MRTILRNSIILILLVLAGCAVQRFQPAPGDYLIEDQFAIVRTDSLVIAIRPQVYRSSNGSNLASDSFSLYLQVQNISPTNISLSDNTFQILVNERQFSPIPTDFLLMSFREVPIWDWQDPLNPISERESGWQQQEEDRYHLLANTFRFGEILNGARQEGFLFYDAQISRADSIVVNVLGQRVGFVRQ
jgi:hypothetical protein